MRLILRRLPTGCISALTINNVRLSIVSGCDCFRPKADVRCKMPKGCFRLKAVFVFHFAATADTNTAR